MFDSSLIPGKVVVSILVVANLKTVQLQSQTLEIATDHCCLERIVGKMVAPAGRSILARVGKLPAPHLTQQLVKRPAAVLVPGAERT